MPGAASSTEPILMIQLDKSALIDIKMQKILQVCPLMTALIFVLWAISAEAQLSDSLFLEVRGEKELSLRYRVGPKETWYSIARKFNTHLNDIKRDNPNLLFYDRPPEFAILTIPVDPSTIHYRFPLFRNREYFHPVYYRVRPKDNFFRITRVYFDIPPSLLRQRNQLEGETLPAGIVLQIGWIELGQIEDLIVYDGRKVTSGSTASLGSLHERFREQESKYKVTQENGVAWWNKENEKSSGMYVMHRQAASNTIIELTNPMFNTILYAKVIGKIPDNMYAQEIDLVVTSEIAEKLKVVDRKFFCRMRFIDSKDVVSH